jgi:hypothetical protein
MESCTMFVIGIRLLWPYSCKNNIYERHLQTTEHALSFEDAIRKFFYLVPTQMTARNKQRDESYYMNQSKSKLLA